MRTLVRLVPPAVAVAAALAIWQGAWSLPAIVAYVVVAAMVVIVVGYVQLMKRSDRFYRARIAAGLERAWRRPDRILEVDLSELKLVVFSDQHKGTRDGADDFWRAERAYRAALAHYLELGHRLVVLGDAEELWECRADRVVDAYRDVLALEAAYHAAERYERVYGNHDDDWRKPRLVARHLSEQGPFRSAPAVHQSIVVRVTEGADLKGVLFLVHGHQGTADSEVLSRIARPAVSLFGWLQRKFNRPWNTPATDWQLRDRHDRAMSLWAESRADERLVLIAGHTHRPVFWNSRPTPPDPQTIEDLERRLADTVEPAERARLRARIEHLASMRAWMVNLPASVESPAYFNTGCCSFADGDVTGLEIVDERVRLVRWLDNDGTAVPKELDVTELREVFDRVGALAGRRPAARV